MRHSQGPWKEVGDEIHSHTKEPICRVYSVKGDNSKRYGMGESDANARLMVTAPELLASLENIMFHRDHMGLGDNEYYTNARAAIAKATCTE